MTTPIAAVGIDFGKIATFSGVQAAIFEGLRQNGRQVGRALEPISVRAVGFGQFHKIRVGEIDGQRLVAIHDLLHADKPKPVVVQDQHDDVEAESAEYRGGGTTGPA